jgi:uncharacterized protein YndB with AHSA1/START domain
VTFVETGLDLRLERMLDDVTPQQAYDAWIDSAGRRNWYTPVAGWTIEADGDVRVDGKWFARFGPTADEMYSEEGVYVEVDPPHKLAYTNVFTFPDGRGFTTLNVVTFEAVDGGTRLVIEDRGYPSEEQRDAHQQGWPSFLDMFERHLATL